MNWFEGDQTSCWPVCFCYNLVFIISLKWLSVVLSVHGTKSINKILNPWHPYSIPTLITTVQPLKAPSLQWRHNERNGADQRNHQSFASLAFVRRLHSGSVESPHKWSVTRKMLLFDDVIMVTFFTFHMLRMLMYHNILRVWFIIDILVFLILNFFK